MSTSDRTATEKSESLRERCISLNGDTPERTSNSDRVGCLPLCLSVAVGHAHTHDSSFFSGSVEVPKQRQETEGQG